jgi:hypothetical protein
MVCSPGAGGYRRATYDVERSHNPEIVRKDERADELSGQSRRIQAAATARHCGWPATLTGTLLSVRVPSPSKPVPL